MNEQEQNNTHLTPRNSIQKLVVGAFLLILIVSVTLNIVLLIQKNNQHTLIVKNSCGTDDILKSNEILSTYTEEKMSSEYKDLAESISNRENWEEDINCRYILFQSAVLRNDANTVEKQFVAMKDLNESGYSLNLRFDNILSIKSIESVSDQLKQGTVNTDTTLGGAPESPTEDSNE